MPARVAAAVWVAVPDWVLGCLSFAALSAAVRVWRVGQYEFGSDKVMSVMSFCLENDDPISSRFPCLDIINSKCDFRSVRWVFGSDDSESLMLSSCLSASIR